MIEPEEISAAEYVALKVKERKPNKYLNKKTTVDGYDFDSLKEARHYGILKLREAAGEIIDLRLQPKFDLVVNGTKVGFYKADFEYWDDETYTRHVVDVKSPATKTPVYNLKKRMVKAIYGIDVEEV